MVVVKIKDYVANASSYEDGEVIFKRIKNEILSGSRVNVDFGGIKSIPSAFVNAAFVRLLEYVDFDIIRERLIFSRSTKQINELIRSRFEFVVREMGKK